MKSKFFKSLSSLIVLVFTVSAQAMDCHPKRDNNQLLFCVATDSDDVSIENTSTRGPHGVIIFNWDSSGYNDRSKGIFSYISGLCKITVTPLKNSVGYNLTSKTSMQCPLNILGVYSRPPITDTAHMDSAPYKANCITDPSAALAEHVLDSKKSKELFDILLYKEIEAQNIAASADKKMSDTALKVKISAQTVALTNHTVTADSLICVHRQSNGTHIACTTEINFKSASGSTTTSMPIRGRFANFVYASVLSEYGVISEVGDDGSCLAKHMKPGYAEETANGLVVESVGCDRTISNNTARYSCAFMGHR